MITFQFIAYNLTFLLVIAHFLDSAKESEWTDFTYNGSYPLWLITSLALIALALVGIVPVYLDNHVGDVLSVIVAIGGLGVAGYPSPCIGRASQRSVTTDSRMSSWLL